jgi:hypothetical protein
LEQATWPEAIVGLLDRVVVRSIRVAFSWAEDGVGQSQPPIR